MGREGETALHYIDGEWLDDGETLESLNPADGTRLGSYVVGSRALAEEAAVVARRTFLSGSWAAFPRLRAKVPTEFADRLEVVILAENGKLKREASGELAGAISEARYCAGLARTVLERTQETAPGNLSLLNREAAGVAAIIVPWNAPVTLLVRSLGPALAAGCTVAIKCAAQTPLIHARVMRCLADCPSLPRGVVNSVNECGSRVGEVNSFEPNYRGSPIVHGAGATNAIGGHVFKAQAGHHLAPQPLSDGRNLHDAPGGDFDLIALDAPSSAAAAFP